MTAAVVAELLIGIIEVAKISSLLVSENRTATPEEDQRVRAAVKRANYLWEAAG